MKQEERLFILKDKKMKEKKVKDPKSELKKVSNRMLIVSVINIMWFTIVAIILQFRTSIELSSTLITCWYTFWTGEIFALAGIRISKVRYTDPKEEVDEDGMVG